MTDETSLSGYQQQVLRDLLAHEQEQGEGKSLWLQHRRQGVSRSQSAAWSRAVRRLEERGLVRRFNYQTRAEGAGVGRTTDLLLTSLGRELARTLLTHLRWI